VTITGPTPGQRIGGVRGIPPAQNGKYLRSTVSAPVWGDVQAGDVVGLASATAVAARVYRNTPQVIPNTVWTPISFNTVRNNDFNMWSVSAPTRLTAVRAGTHVISGHVAFQGNAAGTARLATIWVDGAIYSAIQGMTNVVISGPGNPFISIAETIKLQVGDYVELNVYHDSGGNLSTLGGDGGGGWYCSDFTMALIAGAKGDKGDQGNTGATGLQGPAGAGVPAGGTSGQALVKNSATDFDTKWGTVAGGGGGGATDLNYKGDWAAGSYNDGDIVIYNGVEYVAVRPTTSAPTTTDWPAAVGITVPAGGAGQYLQGPASAPTWASPKGTLIGVTQYAPATPALLSVASATAVANMAVTFTAPASGSVLVKCSVMCQATYQSVNGEAAINCQMYSGGVAIGFNQKLFSSNIASYQIARGNFTQVYTGLTPGNSYTFTPNFISLNGNAGWIGYGGAVGLGGNPPYGPAVTEVWSV
jgi:hypothetical protein